MNSLFTPTPDMLGHLSARDAVVAFRDLLWAQAYRLRIPVSCTGASLGTCIGACQRLPLPSRDFRAIPAIQPIATINTEARLNTQAQYCSKV